MTRPEDHPAFWPTYQAMLPVRYAEIIQRGCGPGSAPSEAAVKVARLDAVFAATYFASREMAVEP